MPVSTAPRPVGFFAAWQAARSFKKLPPSARKLVFYSEGKAYWPHLGPLVRELVEGHGIPVTYVSSSPDDPGLVYKPEKVKSFCIGPGTWCTLWFMQLEAEVLVMTMPDLGVYHIQRSKSAPVQYVYVQHAAVSSHMMYREQAFDNFDTVFIAGPHHETEIRLREKMFALKPKRLFAHGYGRMDDLLKEADTFPGVTATDPASPLQVTIAPSWGERGIFESCGRELIRVLLENGFAVTFRPHPQSLRSDPAAIHAYRVEFGAHPRFRLDSDPSSSASVMRADVLITDWSGVAYDYALVLKRPVLFIEVPRKVKNPNYEKLPVTPLEVAVREEIGEILKPDGMKDAPALVRLLFERRAAYAQRCEKALHKWIYNVGTSAAAGAAELLRMVSE